MDDAPQQPTAVPSPATETCFAHRPWLVALVLVIVTFAAYQPTWRAGFIWDDDDHLTTNPAMTAPHGLKMIWSSLAVSRYYPLTLTSFWVERRLWGLDPLPYHQVNIALHALNGFLIFLVLHRLRVPAAWLAAMLWALHPVNVESVAWITELKNTQSGLFFFLSVLCFLHVDEQKNGSWYALAIGCGLAAMLSKPSTVVLPVALLLCVWWERGHWRRVDWVRIAPFFLLALGMSALTVVEQRGHIQREGTAEWNLGMAERFVLAGKAVWFYASKLLWPARLTFVYPRWKPDAGSFLSWLPLAALVAMGMILWVWRRQVWARAALFGFGFFVAALVPVLGFLEVYYFRYSFVADHFQYLASIGLIALAVSTAAMVSQRGRRWGRRLGTLVAAAVLLLLGLSTWRQAHAYQDLETLWRDTLAKNPNAWIAQYNLGTLFLESNRVSEAIGQFEETLRLKPDHLEAHNNLGNALARLGRLQEAIGQYQQALRIKPDYAKTYNNLGNALLQAGRVQEAVGQYEQALRLKPDLAEAQNNLAWLLATLPPAQGGDPIRAVELARRSCEPDHSRSADYLDTLGIAYAAAGQFDAAIAAAQRAIDLARAAGQTNLVKEIAARLELYRSGRAYSPSTAVTSPGNP